MNERVYNSGVERLRSPERTGRLEVERVVDLCLNGSKIASVLDIGTGSGLFAEAFYKRNIKVSGIDANQEMLIAAKDYLPNCQFKLASAESLPFEDKSFDMIFMGLVFHEVDDFNKVLKEIERVSVKQAAILEWNYEVQEFGPPLEHRLKPEFIEQLSKDAGFISFTAIPLTNLSLYLLS
ncbi:MAG: class I SAM-dependent methyltransferase [Ignavibacteriales bacterium]|nr:class I SAM-dependent methyltransferase [Ignavibacteriales bacterium]